MSLLDTIEAAEDVEQVKLYVPSLGATILFKGLTFVELAELNGSLDLAAIEEKSSVDQMKLMLTLTAFDPETGEKLFDSERGQRVLEGLGYKTILYMMTKGATPVMGVDEDETAGKDSSSTPTAIPALEESSTGLPETPAAQSPNYSTEQEWEDFDL